MSCARHPREGLAIISTDTGESGVTPGMCAPVRRRLHGAAGLIRLRNAWCKKNLAGWLKRRSEMSTNLFVGNLPFTTGSPELEELFTPFGEVSRAQVITDRDTGRSRGFGFVEMDSDEAAQKAIEELDGSDYEGRQLKVNVARERSR
jgi:RNA recognition motif-containing protein